MSEQSTTAGARRQVAGATCVVTGGLGFIGSNLVLRLLAEGATVRIIDALIAAHGGDLRNVASGVETLVAPISDPQASEFVHGADIIFNLAGQVSHAASMTDPLTDLRLNALDHAVFLETVRAVAPRARVVHASTRQVYGRVDQLPADETTAANPVDVNGVAKLAGEQLHMVYAGAHSMALTSLRLTNVYGPRQRLTSDELGFLPVFVRRALLGEPITIFGDGQQRRDCLYVDDVVDAILAATADRAIGRVYNVGHPKNPTLAEVAELIVFEGASASQISYVPWPAEHQSIDIGSFHTASERIRSELGWSAQIDMADGIRRTFAFYREHPWYLSSR